MIIICYMGGTAGDLVTATIDGTDTRLDDRKVIIDSKRSKLKKPHLFATSSETVEYIKSMTENYSSLPSHCLDFHVEQRQDFIGIVVNTMETATWAATRFKELHLPHVWEEVMKYSNISKVEEYASMMLNFSETIKKYTTKIISLEDILSGNLLTELDRLNIQATNPSLYENWLSHR